MEICETWKHTLLMRDKTAALRGIFSCTFNSCRFLSLQRNKTETLTLNTVLPLLSDFIDAFFKSISHYIVNICHPTCGRKMFCSGNGSCGFVLVNTLLSYCLQGSECNLFFFFTTHCHVFRWDIHICSWNTLFFAHRVDTSQCT